MDEGNRPLPAVSAILHEYYQGTHSLPSSKGYTGVSGCYSKLGPVYCIMKHAQSPATVITLLILFSVKIPFVDHISTLLSKYYAEQHTQPLSDFFILPVL